MVLMLQSVLLAIFTGGLSGFVSHLITNKKSLDYPKKMKTKWYLGFIADILIGAAAAVFAVTFLLPEADTLRTVIGVSVLAGVSGESVLMRRTLANEQNKLENLKEIDDRINRIQQLSEGKENDTKN